MRKMPVIFLFIVAGRWMAKSGGMTVQTGALVIRFIGALGMAVVGMMANSGVAVAERVPLAVGENPLNEAYLRTKAAKSGHLL